MDPAVLWFALPAAGVYVVVAIFVTRWRAKTGGIGRVPPPDPADRCGTLREEDYDLVLRGSASVNGLTATGRSARLLVTRDQAELRHAHTFDPIRFSRAEVTGLLWSWAPFGSRSLKFRTASGRLDKVTFWTRRAAEEQLAELGWY
ncbi:hypothetical protein ACWEGE_46090 [Amycolatopsis sp. NPDC004747]